MGRTLKKVLIGSGLAFAVFLATIFLFGDRNDIALTWPDPSDHQPLTAARSPNLTKTFSEKLADQILKDNPNGPQITEKGEAVLALNDPSSFVTKAIAAEGDRLSPENLIADIDETRIRVQRDVTNEVRAKYVQSLLGILKTNIKTPFGKTSDNEELFTTLIKEREAARDELYSLVVPTDLREIHEEILTLLGTQINIFTAFKNSQEDPLGALVAAKFEGEVIASIDAVIAELTEYLIKHNLGS